MCSSATPPFSRDTPPLLSPLSQLRGILDIGGRRYRVYLRGIAGFCCCHCCPRVGHVGQVVAWSSGGQWEMGGVVSVVLARVKWLLMKVSIRFNAACCRGSRAAETGTQIIEHFHPDEIKSHRLRQLAGKLKGISRFLRPHQRF